MCKGLALYQSFTLGFTSSSLPGGMWLRLASCPAGNAPAEEIRI
jgi:hypothetical protein